ncbi:DUF2852 domain-containing protein [Parvularcula sp. IMCC14364]|uniref:DUF2852 domain-containing protein n=1 Tax=Parvularcula sp. IMCC14364 TaxID=3067902 RepID=UPI0027412969|nr:DUF2852 domain-containing protein [Parvularcula sp. IMCC14364]
MNTTTSSSSSQGNWRHQLRPAWTPLNIAIMVVSFMTGVFWFVGVFMIAYMIWGRDWGLDFSTWGNVEQSMNRMGDNLKSAFDGKAQSNRTGNAAFDEWRDAEIKRLEEERKKLEDAKQEFQSYMEELQKARDKEEFDRFWSQWNARRAGDTGPGSTGPGNTGPGGTINL